MPKKTKDFLKKDAAQATHNLERALADIKDLHDRFAGIHDDYAEYLQFIAILIMQAQEEVYKFAKLAWLTDKEALDTYRTN